jgi:uncharacterized protein (DUF1499 family)
MSQLTVFTLGIVAAVALTGCAASIPPAVGQLRTTGRLAPCPSDADNCVNSTTDASDRKHAIAPLTYTGTAADAKARLLAVVAAMPRARVVTDEETYLHAEFTSLIFRFVDDVEFVIDDAAKTIHFRSASRVGRGDMGVNRKRMEEIRAKFQG